MVQSALCGGLGARVAKRPCGGRRMRTIIRCVLPPARCQRPRRAQERRMRVWEDGGSRRVAAHDVGERETWRVRRRCASMELTCAPAPSVCAATCICGRITLLAIRPAFPVVGKSLRWRSAADVEAMAIIQKGRKCEWSRRRTGRPCQCWERARFYRRALCRIRRGEHGSRRSRDLRPVAPVRYAGCARCMVVRRLVA